MRKLISSKFSTMFGVTTKNNFLAMVLDQIPQEELIPTWDTYKLAYRRYYDSGCICLLSHLPNHMYVHERVYRNIQRVIFYLYTIHSKACVYLIDYIYHIYIIKKFNLNIHVVSFCIEFTFTSKLCWR